MTVTSHPTIRSGFDLKDWCHWCF